MGGGLLLGGTAYLLGSQTKGLTDQQIMELDAQEVNAFDRAATENWSPSAGHASDYSLYLAMGSAGLAVPLAPLAVGGTKGLSESGFWTLGVLLFETNVVNAALTETTKLSFKRARPFVYNPSAPHEEKVLVDARKSFFSGHSSITACNAFFAAKVFHDYFPESAWRYAAWGGAAAVSGFTAWQRVRAGKHFPTDVITGVAVGALIGWAIPQLHKTKAVHNGEAKAFQWKAFPFVMQQGSGMGIQLRF